MRVALATPGERRMDVQRYLSFLRLVVVSAVACWIAGWTSHALQPHFRGSASWQPLAGAALALYLYYPRTSWRAIFTGSFLACVIDLVVYGSKYPHPVSYILLPLLHSLGPLVGGRVFSSQARGSVRFERLHDVNLLILGPCFLVAALFAGFEVAASRWLGGGLVSLEDWIRVWVRDALGYLIVAPLILVWLSGVRSRAWTKPAVIAEAALGLGLTILTGRLAFLYAPSEPLGPYPFLYMPFPVLVLAALRRGPKGATLTCFVLAITVLIQPLRARDGLPLSPNIRMAEIRWMQLYLILGAGMSLMLASVTRERELTAEALESSERRAREIAANLRAAEQKARTTEDLYRRAITAANAVPYLRDYRTEQFTFMGEGIRELTGFSAHEMTPDLWESLVREHVMRGAAEGLSYSDAVRRARLGELHFWLSDALVATRDGRERWISDASVEILGEDGKPTGSIGVLLDISDRKRAEEAMRAAKEGLEGRMVERTAELEAAVRELEAFTYSISHDLRAPLRAIEGFSRILEEDHVQQLQGDGSSHLSRVRAAAIRMDHLINDLLIFSRLNRQPVSRQSFSMQILAKDALEDLRLEQLNRRIEIRHRDLPPAYGDPELMRHVVRNLLSNALKYTRNRELAEIEIGWELAKGETVYFIRDNGAGFNMAYADKLFGVFQKLHRFEEFEGSGVGLAVAHRILRRHGGRIWADSAVDQGATFFFTLPSAPQASELNSGAV
ncbi:MAG: MASE1 domain-containing protein [Verrucomicrobia bacterium]|nr:MASE1 domain-containing protein [Verrucomicrobiota bacterium]